MWIPGPRGAPVKRSEIRLYERAMKQRWPISDQQRGEIVNALMATINNPLSSERDKTSAARALMSAEQMNQSDEQHAATEFREMILNYADQRGLSIDVIGGTGPGTAGADAQRIADSSNSSEGEEGREK